MKFFPKIACLLLLANGAIFPITLASQSSQSSSSAPGSALNERQRAGKRLLMQNCGLCHLPTGGNPKDPKDQGTTLGPPLNGLFRRANPASEDFVRELIRQGTEKMPGFRYALEPKEIDNIIAYLKTL